MTLPIFTAEQSLYRSSRHYRSSALATITGGVHPSDGLSDGTYLQSCFNCTYDADSNTLTCFCYDESGGNRQATLDDVPSCIGDIGNNNGYLNCYSDQGELMISISSQRYKEDIRDIARNDAEALLQLRPVTFRYRQGAAEGANQAPRYGLIAEEVAELLPQVVARDADGQVIGIDYYQFPALLLGALQREHTVIEAQDQRLHALESQLAAAEAARPSD